MFSLGSPHCQATPTVCCYAARMEGHGSVEPPASGSAWRRPPWSTPSGRRPRYRQVLRIGFGLDALYMAAFSGMYVTTVKTSWMFEDLRPFSIFFIGIAGLAFAYGVTVILTSGRPRGVMPAWLGLNVNRSRQGVVRAGDRDPSNDLRRRSLLLFAARSNRHKVRSCSRSSFSHQPSSPPDVSFVPGRVRIATSRMQSSLVRLRVTSCQAIASGGGTEPNGQALTRQRHLRRSGRQTAITGGPGATGAHYHPSHGGCQRRPGPRRMLPREGQSARALAASTVADPPQSQRRSSVRVKCLCRARRMPQNA